MKRRFPNVVFSHNSKSSLIPLLGAWLADVPVRVYFNHGVPYIAYRGILRWLLFKLERWNFAMATHVVTVSTDMSNLLKGVSSQPKVEVIHNGSACGIDVNAFSSNLYDRNYWRHTHGIKDYDFVVVFVGRPEKRKGFDFILRLWVNHFNEMHFKLVLCGPSADDVLKCLGYKPPNIIELGFVDNVPEVLSSSEVMILPSLHEGLSYACLEAQAASALVIANDILGIRCVIENKKTGFLVADNEPSKYVEIIRTLYKNPQLLDEIRIAAKKSVGHFSREFFIPVYLSFLSALVLEQNKKRRIYIS